MDAFRFQYLFNTFSSPGQQTKAQSLTCVVVPLQSPEVQFLTKSRLPPPQVAEQGDASVQLLYIATLRGNIN